MSTRQEKRDLLKGWNTLFNACKCLADQSHIESGRWADANDLDAFKLICALRRELADEMYTVGKR